MEKHTHNMGYKNEKPDSGKRVNFKLKAVVTNNTRK